MNYLVHPHEPIPVLAANYLETRGGVRRLAGITACDEDTIAITVAEENLALKGRFLRTLRPENHLKGGNATTLGVPIPEWAAGAKEVIVINSARANETAGLQDALYQMHCLATGIKPLKKKNSRRRSRSRRDKGDFGRYSIMG